MFQTQIDDGNVLMIFCPSVDCESVLGPSFAQLFLAPEVMERSFFFFLYFLFISLILFISPSNQISQIVAIG